VKVPTVSIALSLLCNRRVSAHLRLHDPEPAVSNVGFRPHLSHIVLSPSQSLGQSQIIMLDDKEAHVCEH